MPPGTSIFSLLRDSILAGAKNITPPLSDATRAILATRFRHCGCTGRGCYEKRAKERKKAGGGDKKSAKARSLPAILPEAVSTGRDARDEAGAAFGVGGRTVDRATAVWKKGGGGLPGRG